jgi:hypothetical protein
MNNFVSPDLYQPDYDDFTIESKGCRSGATEAEDSLSDTTCDTSWLTGDVMRISAMA